MAFADRLGLNLGGDNPPLEGTYNLQDASRNPITYGVELQFFVPLLWQGMPDPHPNDDRGVFVVEEGATYQEMSNIIIYFILRVLREEAAIPTWTYRGPPPPSVEALNMMDRESQAIANMPAYSQWIVESAPELLPWRDPLGESYKWVAIKVKSNMRISTQLDHFDPIMKAVITLRKYFRIRLPPSTSLMIHVGERYRDTMTYELCPIWFRRFCTMWWFIETHIFLLSHPSRRTNRRCLPLKTTSLLGTMANRRLAQKMREGGGTQRLYEELNRITPLDSLTEREADEVELIWVAGETTKLTELLMAWRVDLIPMGNGVRPAPDPVMTRGSLGFQGFTDGADPTAGENNNGDTGTIEFRSMESTLDPRLILNWIAVVTRLVDFSRRGATNDIKAIIDRATEGYGGLPLLRDIGLEVQATYFQDKVNRDANTGAETLENMFVPPYTEN